MVEKKRHLSELQDDDKQGSRLGVERAHRLKAGGVGVAASLVLVFVIEKTVLDGAKLPEYIVLAIASLVGSFTTGATICFWDIHDLLFTILRDQREKRGRR